jgi:hypothetical protein
MNQPGRNSRSEILAPFAVRSFSFQWPADLLTSWAGEMEVLILVPMAVMLLHGVGARLRGRVMGVRMLAIYGLPIGLLAAGGLIERFGFAATATGYCAAGLLLTGLIAARWHVVLWRLDAPANAR